MSISATQDIVSVKPIHAGEYTNKFLFESAHKILLMSSTILDKDEKMEKACEPSLGVYCYLR